VDVEILKRALRELVERERVFSQRSLSRGAEV